MKYFALIVVALVLMAVPTFAGGPHDDPPAIMGSADATSQVGGSVLSGNYTTHGIGGSFAMECARNTSYAGFTVSTVGNTVYTSAFGDSVGHTFGIVIGTGVAQGLQGGAFNAFVTGAIPLHGISH